MEWLGRRPYEEFMQKLAQSNPTLLWKTKSEPQEYRVAASTTPGSNSPARAASTFIRNIRYLPYTQTTLVRMGNSQYFYPMNERQLATWLKSKSLGKYYNQWIKLK